ncbi:right-handed parallel beta-helix repeat-containing protein [Lactobacillus xujianguonis]|uniref:Right-handed parallel beta-helix repeat-containing protein n=1 Tax=Lactobacillus xujianguonis TaxID=2495899 RepID=A0A437SUX9_9LACO|nr:right-handed parallel beta-helix repeat-containing protein [Lactobacillus xujianguonis]RVU70741.1 right-handed parallel beta-helix repeat-containing protein [Lactobacillus xujianguonis]RVU73998.1 right-handed parallel beta-helix repeat-containing protein [Lactobacillus xujianguonis]
MKIYVNQQVQFNGDGTKQHPFKLIQSAANIAQAGDTVLVYPGVYHENVNPKYAGTADQRITYQSVIPKKAVITGAERITNWQKINDQVWQVIIPNSFFTERNPYTTRIFGDWFNNDSLAHTGEVYLNDQALYEVDSLAKVENPEKNNASWHPEDTIYTWFTQQDKAEDATIIWANFQGKNPNLEQVEINVRKSCFYPQEEGISYLTLNGFTITKAATQWAPPTAYQEGMVGPHWSKGWIIENCDLSHSKCAGISLGKYFQANNDNKWSKWKYKDGTQTERDAICQASYEGWDKEHVGSHLISHNVIHDCGQTGIVGHLGAVFSTIADNEIYNINIRRNLSGAEIAGIKLHAAIDVIIRHNYIHDCTRGLWLDWQAQGTRITQNIFDCNSLPFSFKVTKQNASQYLDGLGEDIWIELSHGPTLLDNNIFLSDRSIRFATEGVACVHNLFAGVITAVGKGTNNNAQTLPSNRYSPYHQAHDTQVAGFMTILHGDDKFYNNVFVQAKTRPEMKELARISQSGPNDWDDNNLIAGTSEFDAFPTFEKWQKQFTEPNPDPDRYYKHLPVWIKENVYLNGAKSYQHEVEPLFLPEKVFVKLERNEHGLFLRTNLDKVLQRATCDPVSTQSIPMAFESEEKYENPDGSPITFNTDVFGNLRSGTEVMAGPFISSFDQTKSLFN